jgi:hypothetical protein
VSSPTLKPPTHAYISITIVIVYYFCYLLVILYHQQKTIPLSFFRYIQYSICSLSLYSEFIWPSHCRVTHFVLFSFFFSYLHIYIAVLSGQLASLYFCICIVMKLLTKKGISRNKASLLSFEKLCNLSFFLFFPLLAHTLDSYDR